MARPGTPAVLLCPHNSSRQLHPLAFLSLQVLAAVIFTPENTTTSSASGRISSPRSSSPATLASGSAVGIMPGSAGATSFGPGTGMPAEMLAGSGSNSANGSAVRAALLSTGTGAVGQGSASLEGQLARAQRPRQLGFAIQTNSSVQWFKGTYQHPNTYIQVGWRPGDLGVCLWPHCHDGCLLV